MTASASGRPTHLVWDWNGTLIDDLSLVISATNAAFASVGGRDVDADEHRRLFRRPIADFYGHVLGRVVGADEFAQLDKLFHDAYRQGLVNVALAADAEAAMRSWPGTQSLLSMWFHDELVPTIERYGLADLFTRVDGRRQPLGGAPDSKAHHLVAHLDVLGLTGDQVVLIGDSIDDADAARAVGARCVLYSGGFTHPEQLRASGLPVADTLTDAVRLAATT
ncbi:MAG TPA: HAD hydrolase-like protein [Pilimelia sp.]|nr:HAD hydrolase-like protein [Pilimelia sp.]